MNLTISEKKENALLSRMEITARLQFEGVTPDRKSVQQEVAKQLKAKEPMVVVKQIATEFGAPFAKVTAYVYSNEAAMTRLERKNLLEKHIGHEPKAEEAQD